LCRRWTRVATAATRRPPWRAGRSVTSASTGSPLARRAARCPARGSPCTRCAGAGAARTRTSSPRSTTPWPTASTSSPSPSAASPPSPYFEDAAAIGSFHAMRRGVVTSAGAGNAGGRTGGRVCNVAPWMLSIAASSIDRRMVDKIVLGNGKTIVVLFSTLVSRQLNPYIMSLSELNGRLRVENC
jgi:hypothetical protein